MTQPSGFTVQQYRLFCFVRDYVAKHGYSPTFEEIRIELGLRSKSGIARLVDGLVERGRLTREPNRARSVTICSVSHETRAVAA